uniref:Sodium/hydrogen exchanger n=1 Tax=Oreochromis niloticus TaxID=8128 RepID=A0A669EYG5_ORENI
MRGVSVKALSFLLLFISLCVSERAERENSLSLHERDDDGGNVKQQDNIIAEEGQTVENHEKEHGLNLDSNELQKDGSSLSKSNDTTDNYSNDTLHSTTTTVKPTTPAPPTVKPILPVQTGVKAQEEEQSSGMTIFFSLLVIGICIILVHLLIKFKLHFLPESVAVVSLGKYCLCIKFCICPTISAFIVGGGIYFLGQADVIYKMTMTDSFAFGSLISAVDPVATIAIFNALNVDPVLNMLVFGESILNDAVSIVLTNTAEGFFSRSDNSTVTGWETFLQALGYFLNMFFGSAALGTLTGLISALFLKHFDLRNTPSLEFGMMIIFAYLPYGLAEGIKLSGIMSILFAGIVMSHYTHHNLSPVTQILMQQTLRTVAFMCETCVFAFLGLSIFSFPHKFEISFVIWCIVLVLVGRAVNIFPLSFLLNFCRDHKITPKMMFIMWFSGLRGAIPYALSLHLGLEPIEKRQLIGTTTIIIVLFTILFLGGGTMPLIRIMDIEDSQSRRKNKKDINLSKTQKMGNTIESEHLSELTEEEYEAQIYQRQDLKGFMWLDAKYLNPFFTRRLTQEDLLHGRIQMKTLTNKWYEEVRQGPSGSEDDEDEAELL